ncbi:MAG: hypothetical protein JWM21_2099 [Acidobacteria bacterium]|nr:hypothetical protein [Acidobacteriota bacterium]
MVKPLTERDRIAAREQPKGRPLMHQSWGELLFMHWRIDPVLLRPLMPQKLELDLFDGSAWIAIVPFTMWNTRALFLPPIPGISAMHELNVRTYVYYDGVPGVWFFSLDCTSAAAVLGARTTYFLPYYNADIKIGEEDATVDYSLTRTEDPPAEFHARWTIGESLPEAKPDSLEFFLTERYCLYSEHRGRIYRARIHHQPWPLRRAEISKLNSTMIEALGLETPEGDPLLHYAKELKVDIWSLKTLSG